MLLKLPSISVVIPIGVAIGSAPLKSSVGVPELICKSPAGAFTKLGDTETELWSLEFTLFLNDCIVKSLFVPSKYNTLPVSVGLV